MRDGEGHLACKNKPASATLKFRISQTWPNVEYFRKKCVNVDIYSALNVNKKLSYC